MSDKKIAIVTAVFPPYRGGIGTVALNQAVALSERSCDITVFAPDYGFSPAKSISDGKFSLEFLKPIFKYGNAAFVPNLKKKFSAFDVVILEYPFFGGMRAVYRAKKKYNFKLILNYNMDVVGRGLKGLVFWYATKVFLPKIVKISDIVLASSVSYAKNSELGKFWKDGDKFRVLPNGVDVSKFKPGDVDFEFKKMLNIKPDEKIILFVGGLDKAHYFKGVPNLIKAAKIIEDLNFKIVIAGSGNLLSEYDGLARSIGVKDKILFAGSVSEKALVKLYRLAYLTCLPSEDKSESFGIVLVESMASGTPVIASNLPGVCSVFEDGISGFLVESKNPKDLAEKISYMIKNTSKREEMSHNCLELVAKKYDSCKIGDKLRDIVVL